MSSLKGKLLIAHPNIKSDSPWHKTVIFLYDITKQGHLGLILNIESSFTVKQLCNQKGIMYDDGVRKIHTGGPVAQESIVMLHTNEWQSENTMNAGSKQRLSSDEIMFRKIAYGDVPAWYRVFAGICGWAPGQLEMELSGRFPYKPENSWLIAQANDDLVYGYTGHEQWDVALQAATEQAVSTWM